MGMTFRCSVLLPHSLRCFGISVAVDVDVTAQVPVVYYKLKKNEKNNIMKSSSTSIDVELNIDI